MPKSANLLIISITVVDRWEDHVLCSCSVRASFQGFAAVLCILKDPEAQGFKALLCTSHSHVSDGGLQAISGPWQSRTWRFAFPQNTRQFLELSGPTRRCHQGSDGKESLSSAVKPRVIECRFERIGHMHFRVGKLHRHSCQKRSETQVRRWERLMYDYIRMREGGCRWLLRSTAAAGGVDTGQNAFY